MRSCILSLMLLELLVSQSVRGAPTMRETPPIIKQSGEAIQYLWNSVQRGTFHNRILGQSEIETAWRSFLKTEGTVHVTGLFR